MDEILHRFYFYFSRDQIIPQSDEASRILDQAKEKITDEFYSDYIRYVFGIELEKKKQSKKGQNISIELTKTRDTYSLLKCIRPPDKADEQSKRLFVITLMSRLIFIKFLEDKGLVKPRLLSTLWRTHQGGNVLTSFYRAYLQPLFYDVLNSPVESRKIRVMQVSEYNTIPYLNGGLFREVVQNELQYDIEDEILGSIIKMLEGYTFTLEDNPKSLNPDILGLVFEKTINHLTGEKQDRRKKLGAYYTPDDVTTFITGLTIRPRVLELIKEQLRKDGWKEVEVDGYTSLDDFFSDLPKSPKVIRGIYDKISRITVLDPACGSGHFLASALKELFMILKNLSGHFQNNFTNYQIKREIITNCLYGVDIENAAVEIARLRLWLSLIEDLDATTKKKEIETLPNIDYNIEEGNSLLGLTSSSVMQTGVHEDGTISVQNSVQNTLRELYNAKKAYRKNPNPKDAKEIRDSIEARINAFNAVLHKRLVANLSTKNVYFSEQNIASKNPFHWPLRFSDVLAESDGFDIIIGNPPYIQNHELDYPVVLFSTAESKNTYAHFFDLSIQILKPRGYVGFIVPIPSICTEEMIPLQELLKSSCSSLQISNFDDRPSKIFHGLEHCRSSIIVCKKRNTRNRSRAQISVTKYNRWYSDERIKLFKNLEFIDATSVVVKGIIPKLGTDLEVKLLSKLRQNPPLLQKLSESGKDNETIWYHRAIQYWIKAMDRLPSVKSKTEDWKTMYVNNPNLRNLVIAILNSSLFYWFFIVSSDARHLNVREIQDFPIDLDSMSTALRKKLTFLSQSLMKDYSANSKKMPLRYKEHGEITIEIFYPKHSKSIIDDIDDVLAEHYGFSREESEFIKHFDEHFRVGEEVTADSPLMSS